MRDFLKIILPFILCASLAQADGDMLVDIDLNFPNLDTIKKMTDTQAENYLLGVRDAFEELEELQNEQGEKYEAAESAGFDWQKYLGIGTEAFAAVGGQCISGGYPRTRNENGKCPRPERKGCPGASQFRCPIIYGSACVSFSQRATKSCIESAPSVRRILKKMREDQSGEAQAEWTKYETELKNYCTRGSRRLFCHTLRNRLDLVRRSAKVTDRIPAPTQESYTASRETGAPVRFREGDVVLDGSSSASRSYRPYTPPTPSYTPSASAAYMAAPAVYTGPTSDGPRTLSRDCYSEVLIEGFRTNSGVERIIDPSSSYRAFCQGDKAYMNSIMPEIRRRVATLKARIRQRSMGKGRMLAEDVSRVQGASVAIEKCARFINGGGRLALPSSDTIEFIGSEVRVSQRLSNGGVGYTLVQPTYAGVALGFQRPPRRFCDYSFPGLPARSAPQQSPSGATPRAI